VKFFTFNSSSSDAKHTTTLHDDGHITCTCMGFRRSRGKCWHVAEVQSRVDLGIVDKVPKDQESPEEPAIPKPMLAKAIKDQSDPPDLSMYSPHKWIMEEKFDGHRMMVVHTSDGGIRAYSRDGLERRLYSELEDSLRIYTRPGIFDGELIIPGGTSSDVVDLEKIPQSRLMLFDVLFTEENRWLMTQPLHARRAILRNSVTDTERVSSALWYVVDIDTVKEIWDRGGEGVIIKNSVSTYQPGKRSVDWIKVKQVKAAVTTLVGYQAGLLGNYSKMVLRDEHGVKVSVKTLNDHWRAAFSLTPEVFIGMKVVIAYQNKTKDGKYRHPRADHFEEGPLCV